MEWEWEWHEGVDRCGRGEKQREDVEGAVAHRPDGGTPTSTPRAAIGRRASRRRDETHPRGPASSVRVLAGWRRSRALNTCLPFGETFHVKQPDPANRSEQKDRPRTPSPVERVPPTTQRCAKPVRAPRAIAADSPKALPDSAGEPTFHVKRWARHGSSRDRWARRQQSALAARPARRLTGSSRRSSRAERWSPRTRMTGRSPRTSSDARPDRRPPALS